MTLARAASKGPTVRNGFTVIEGDGKNPKDLLGKYRYINARVRRFFAEKPPRIERTRQRVSFSVVDGWAEYSPSELHGLMRANGLQAPTVEDAIRFGIEHAILSYEDCVLIFPHDPIYLPRENGHGLRPYLLTAAYSEQDKGMALGAIRYERSPHATQRLQSDNGKRNLNPLYVCRS